MKPEPYFFLRIFNEEAVEKLIPFKRRSCKEVPFIEYTFYNTTIKKMKQLTFTTTNFILKYLALNG